MMEGTIIGLVRVKSGVPQCSSLVGQCVDRHLRHDIWGKVLTVTFSKNLSK